MLARWIAKERPKELKEVHVSTMVRKVHLPGMKDAKSIHAACKGLIEAGWLGEPEKGEHQQRRREAYIISPHLFEALDRCNCCNSGNSINPK